ncbi:MAG TPA: hypothetical protein VLK33_07800 [Terriglobales bacterium]|nr:hypothetical protein [Terriglobales bacterium]
MIRLVVGKIMYRLLRIKPVWIFGLSLLVSIGWMQSLWLSLPGDEHITCPTFTAHFANASLLISIILLLLSLILAARRKQWILFAVIVPGYLVLDLLLAFGVYVANGDNYLPFDSSISGLNPLGGQSIENFVYNVAQYDSLGGNWYALYQCDSLSIQCDLLSETRINEITEGRFQPDKIHVDYDPSSGVILVLYGTKTIYSHTVHPLANGL